MHPSVLTLHRQKGQPPNWIWTAEADLCVFNIIDVAKKKLASVNRSITLENKAQTDTTLHKPTKNVAIELQATYAGVCSLERVCRVCVCMCYGLTLVSRR